jgi:hypothetical protein
VGLEARGGAGEAGAQDARDAVSDKE